MARQRVRSLFAGAQGVAPFGPYAGTDRFATKVSLAGSIEISDKLKVLEMANPTAIRASMGNNLPLAHIDASMVSRFGLWPTTPVTQVYKAIWARSCLTYYHSSSFDVSDKNLSLHQIYEKYRQTLEVERRRNEELLGQFAQDLLCL